MPDANPLNTDVPFTRLDQHRMEDMFQLVRYLSDRVDRFEAQTNTNLIYYRDEFRRGNAATNARLDAIKSDIEKLQENKGVAGSKKRTATKKRSNSRKRKI